MYYLKTKDLEQRTRLIEHLKNDDILAVFHYVPLHSATAGSSFGRFNGVDQYTTSLSSGLVRLPIWYGLEKGDVEKISDSVRLFYLNE